VKAFATLVTAANNKVICLINVTENKGDINIFSLMQEKDTP
jgi:hypothetical protein